MNRSILACLVNVSILSLSFGMAQEMQIQTPTNSNAQALAVAKIMGIEEDELELELFASSISNIIEELSVDSQIGRLVRDYRCNGSYPYSIEFAKFDVLLENVRKYPAQRIELIKAREALLEIDVVYEKYASILSPRARRQMKRYDQHPTLLNAIDLRLVEIEVEFMKADSNQEEVDYLMEGMQNKISVPAPDAYRRYLSMHAFYYQDELFDLYDEMSASASKRDLIRLFPRFLGKDKKLEKKLIERFMNESDAELRKLILIRLSWVGGDDTLKLFEQLKYNRGTELDDIVDLYFYKREHGSIIGFDDATNKIK